MKTLDINTFPKVEVSEIESVLLAQMTEDNANLITWIEFSNTLSAEQKLEVYNKRIELLRKIEKDNFESMSSDEKKIQNENFNKSMNNNHFTGNMGDLKGEHGNNKKHK